MSLKFHSLPATVYGDDMKIGTKDILGCLPLLASVLGDKYGVIVRIGGETASTDGKIIHIPSLPLESEAEVASLVKGFIDHESAHIRDTDFEAMRNAGMTQVERTIFNMIEDWRVEHKLCEIYPGCRKNLDYLIRRYFVEEEEAGAGDNPALAVMNYILLSIRAWDVEEVDRPKQELHELLKENYLELLDNLEGILVEVKRNCPDTNAAIEYAKRIADCLKSQTTRHEDKKNGQADSSTEAGNEEEISTRQEEAENYVQNQEAGNNEIKADSALEVNDNPLPDTLDDRQNSDSESDDETGENTPSDTAESQEEKPEKETGNGIPQPTNMLDEIENAISGDSFQGLGEKIRNELMEHKSAETKNGFIVAVPTRRFEIVLSKEEKSEALRNSNALSRQLQGLLQGQTLARPMAARSGRLAPRKLYRLATANPGIFVRDAAQMRVETAIHILLDRSTSMSGTAIRIARQACFAIAKALDGIKGINHAVTAFPDYGTDDIPGVVPVKRYGERTGDNFGLGPCGSTPLASALWWIIREICFQKENRRIIVILTDGIPDDLEASKKAIETAKGLGIEVYCLGILSEIARYLPCSASRVIWNIGDLPKAMFELLRTTLLAGGRHDDSR